MVDGNNYQAGLTANQVYDLQFLPKQEQELRMRCLEMANRQPHGGIKDILASAQAMYDFATAGSRPVDTIRALG